ncbi:hypothetical protein [Desulfitobacterium sp. LBE]|uniref:hypothetical protein n=1 Tax=Desulfitobacterium sp. LBE TaxID=884086 RepID=UPI0011A8317B|nr:hypothetical protein [Desulfitobacterium sp. LBE]
MLTQGAMKNGQHWRNILWIMIKEKILRSFNLKSQTIATIELIAWWNENGGGQALFEIILSSMAKQGFVDLLELIT